MQCWALWNFLGICRNDLCVGLLHCWYFRWAYQPRCDFWDVFGRKVSFPREVLYMVAKCLGSICICWLVKVFQNFDYVQYGGGAYFVAHVYTKDMKLSVKIIGTFVLFYMVFFPQDPKHNAQYSHIPLLAPFPIGFAVSWCIWRPSPLLA